MPKMRLSRQHKLQILQLIRDNGLIARSEVMEKTGDSLFLITTTCDELLEKGFVCEAGQGDSTGGRRPALLSIRPGLGRVIGVHMGTVNLRIAMVDFSGNLIAYEQDFSYAEKGPDIAMPHLVQLIDQMLRTAGVSYEELNGIGVGISGVLEQSTGVSLSWPKLPLWVNVPVKQTLTEHFKTLVEIDDTPRTRALAEYQLGGAKDIKHFVYIGIGAGVGAALFLNGEPYAGEGGFAGELGHITVAEDGPLCSCGNRGCLETMVSASALIRRAREGMALGLSNLLTRLTSNKAENISVEVLAHAAREEDRFTVRLLRETSMHLGRAIVGLVNLLNPKLIIIGGGTAAALGEFLLPEIESFMRKTAMIQSAKQVELRISRLEEKAGALGAAELVVKQALGQFFLGSHEAKKIH